jgi:hypothetical protein
MRKLFLSCFSFAIVIAAMTMTEASAQEEGPGDFFRQELQRQERTAPVQQRPTRLIRRAAPLRGFAVEAPDGDAKATQDDPRNPAVTEVAPAQDQSSPAAATEASETFKLAVIGDNMSSLLAQGLIDTFADRRDVIILRRSRDGSGLVRNDWFDWMKAAQDLLNSEKLNAVVLMIGSNDRQAIRDGNVSVEPLSPRWKELYTQRVEALATKFKERKIPLIWVGLPVMRSERFSSDMLAINEITQEQVERSGGIYVDIWDAFLDDRGQFTNYGPDVNGQFQRLRAADGIHFTRGGARKAAYFVESELKRLMSDAKPQIDPALTTIDPHVTREPPPLAPAARQELPQSADPLAALPALAPIPDVFIPVKPAAGQVLPLTGPVSAKGGELATPRRRSNATGEADALIDRTLVQGRPVEPRPGRADDFSWPRR